MRLVLGHAVKIEPRLDRHLAAFQFFEAARSMPAPRRCRAAAAPWAQARGPGRGGFGGGLRGCGGGCILGGFTRGRAAARRASPRGRDRARRFSSRPRPSSISTMCRRRGPCAPSSSFCSMSAVRDGPVMKLTVRGMAKPPSGSANLRAQPVPAVLVGCGHLIGAQERRYACRAGNCCASGCPGPESSISVPVSATAAKQAVTPTASPSSARPLRISRSGRCGPGNIVERGSGASTRRDGRLSRGEIIRHRARHVLRRRRPAPPWR